jgi:hypothetical protein
MSNPLALLILKGLVPLATTTLLGCGESSHSASSADAESDAMAPEDAAANDAADEGTFTALLRESGTPNDYPVTNGRFRVPRGH